MKPDPFFINGRNITPYRLIKALAASGFFLWSVLFFTSCEVINPDEAIPAYIHIDKINLTVNTAVDGGASYKITDAWVYADGSLVGVYELPCTFPILKEGSHDIMIKAGIKMNGIGASRAYYPFFTNYEQQINFVPGQTVDITPTVTYYENKVHYKEGFELAGVTLEKYGISDTNIEKTTSDVCEGVYSGMISLNSTYDYALIATTDAYDLPKNSTPVFLEMNYKTDNEFSVGLFAFVSGSAIKKELIYINKSTEWNKIYINLTYTCVSEPNATNFKLYFEVNKDAAAETATILLDNLKLVYN